MAKARTRQTAKKVKDKWKAKQWYTILAPASFNKTPIAETLGDAPEKVVGRIAMTTMQDLTGDFKLMHVKLHFQVEKVNGNQAETRFIGHSITSDFSRRLVRRNHSKISTVVDATTRDGASIRVKPVAVTDHRSQSSQQTLVRKIIQQTIQETAATMSLGEFAKVMLDGRLSSKMFKACKPIYPLRKIEVNKSEVRTAPTITLEDLEPAAGTGEAPGAETETTEEASTTQESEAPAPEEKVEVAAATEEQ